MIPQKKTIIIVFDRESDNAAESRSLLLQIILLKFTGNFIGTQYKKTSKYRLWLHIHLLLNIHRLLNQSDSHKNSPYIRRAIYIQRLGTYDLDRKSVV